jgi:DNA-binding MarR family transcriptional regulator
LTFVYTPAVPRDETDLLIDRLAVTYPDLDTRPYRVTSRLARLGAHLARRQDQVFEQFGLSRGEVGVLATLRLQGPPHRLTPTRLGRGLMLSSAGMTSRLDRLERRGLVARLPDPDDRRGVLIELTERGTDLVDRAIQANATSEQGLMAPFSDADVEVLETLLRRIATTFEPGVQG